MNAKKSKLSVDINGSSGYRISSLSAFICSPRDTPQGPCGVILFTPSTNYAC